MSKEASDSEGGMLAAGDFSAKLDDGALRRIRIGGTEILRGLSCLVRDADWGTMSAENPADTLEEAHGGALFARSASFGGGAIDAIVSYRIDPGGLTASLSLAVHRDIAVNRAGFVLLHPLAGVSGQALLIRHPGGGETATVFPAEVMPGQPAKNIAGLAHEVAGVAVEIAFEGDIFEMEDQRNWTDASYKTYSRPLALPRPYTLQAGETVRQEVRIAWRKVAGAPAPARAAFSSKPLPFPRLALAAEGRWWRSGDGARLAGSGAQALQARIASGEDAAWLAEAARAAEGAGMRLSLEIIGPPEALAGEAARLETLGIRPASVTALPPAYLQSHQPEGPWPAPTPSDALSAALKVFPGAEIGYGGFTCFTEINRCKPRPGEGAFLAHGTTAIVHAADDSSVMETLEAMPAVFATGRAIAGKRGLRLGLVSIGMRHNPYGAGTMPNPQGLRLPMAETDPRRGTVFAAAFALAAYAIARDAGAEEIALAALSGPFGIAEAPPLAALLADIGRLARLKPLAAPLLPVGVYGIFAEGQLGLLANTSAAPIRAALPSGEIAIPAYGTARIDTWRPE